MTKRKYEKGKKVENINELNSNNLIYIRDKIYHPGWWGSMKYRYLDMQIKMGNVWLANKIKEERK